MSFSLLRHLVIAFCRCCLLVFSPAARDDLHAGAAALERENCAEAIAYLTGAIATAPDEPTACNYRCLARLRVGGYTGAIADCSAALAIAPDDLNARLRRGLALYRQGRFVQAIADFDVAIARVPDHLQAPYNRAAAIYTDRAIAKFPHQVRARLLLGSRAARFAPPARPRDRSIQSAAARGLPGA